MQEDQQGPALSEAEGAEGPALSEAEGAEGPALMYEYRCEICQHVWQGLSQQEIGLVCSNCGCTRIRAPNKRGTYKYKCDECGSKWKKKNSTGGIGFCSTCSNGLPIYPYKFKPDVSDSKYKKLMKISCS